MQKSIAINKTAAEPRQVLPVEETPGLCATCENTPACVYLKAQNGVVMYCEEYHCEPNMQSNPTPEPSPVVEIVQAKGLCVNCEKRETCKYTIPEEGIWHCEEYE